MLRIHTVIMCSQLRQPLPNATPAHGVLSSTSLRHLLKSLRILIVIIIFLCGEVLGTMMANWDPNTPFPIITVAVGSGGSAFLFLAWYMARTAPAQQLLVVLVIAVFAAMWATHHANRTDPLFLVANCLYCGLAG